MTADLPGDVELLPLELCPPLPALQRYSAGLGRENPRGQSLHPSPASSRGTAAGCGSGTAAAPGRVPGVRWLSLPHPRGWRHSGLTRPKDALGIFCHSLGTHCHHRDPSLPGFAPRVPPVRCCWMQPCPETLETATRCGCPSNPPCFASIPLHLGTKSSWPALPCQRQVNQDEERGEVFWGLVWRLGPRKAATVWDEAPPSPFIPPLREPLSWARRHHGHSHGNSTGAVPEL